MRKDQLLKRLKEMLDAVNNDKVTEAAKKSKDEELDKIQKQREMLNYEIQELKTKLEDDSNYQDFSYMKNQAKIYDYNYRIGKIEEEIAQNEANKVSNENRINAVTKEIEASKALLSEAQKDLERYSAELRRLGNNPTPEQDKKVLGKIAEARAGIQFVKNELNQYNDEMKDLLTSKKQINQRLETLANSKDRYNALLNSIVEMENSKKDTIDKTKKESDQRKLLQLQATVKAFTGREEYLSFDFPIEIESLIDNLEKDKISMEEALEKLQEMKAKMPDKLANKDYIDAEDEIAENQRMQADILIEKLALEEKLNNPDNYLPSIFAVEAMNQEINDLEGNVAKYEADIKAIDANIIKYENSKKDYEFRIEQEEKNKESLNSQLFDLRLKQIVLPTEAYESQKDEISQEKRRIQKQINEIDRRIEKLTKASFSSDFSITLAKKERKNLENIRNNEMKLLEGKTKTLNERTGVNKYLMAQDQSKLDSLNSQLEILKMRENAVYYDYETELDEMVARLKKSQSSHYEPKKNETVHEPIISTDGLEGMTIVTDEPKRGETLVSPIVVGANPKRTEEVVTPPVDDDEFEKEENDIPPIIVGANPKRTEEVVTPPVDDDEFEKEENDIPPIVFSGEPERYENDIPPIVFGEDFEKTEGGGTSSVDSDEAEKEENDIPPIVVGTNPERTDDVTSPSVDSNKPEKTEDNNNPVPIVSWKSPNKAILEKITGPYRKNFWRKVKIGLIVAGGLAVGLLLSRCGNEKVVAPSIEEIATVETATPETAEEPEVEVEVVEEEPEAPKKSIEELAWEVIHGDWGNGQDRKDRLTDAGYDYEAVQDKVNKILSHMKKPSTGGNTNTGGGGVVNPIPDSTVVIPDQTTSDQNYQDIIFPNPDYPEEITPDQVPDPVLPDPVYPDPEPEPTLDSVDVTVQPGDTFVIDTPDGSVAVDNSNLENSDVVSNDTNYDYTTSDSIDGVTFDDSTGNIDVAVNPDNVSAPQDNMTEEKTDDYNAVLDELGISEGGMTR